MGSEYEVRLVRDLFENGFNPLIHQVNSNQLSLFSGLGSEDEVWLVRDLFEKGYNPFICSMNSDHCFCPGYQVWETRTRSDLSKTCLGRDTTLQSVRWIVIIVLTWLSGLGREDEVRLCPRLVWEGIQHPWPVRRIVIINCLLWAGLGSEDEVRLVRDLFEKGYNPLIRPVRNISESIEVQFNLALSQLISVVSTHVRVTINYDASYDHSRYQTRCLELLFRQLEPLTYDVSLMPSRGQTVFWSGSEFGTVFTEMSFLALIISERSHIVTRKSCWITYV